MNTEQSTTESDVLIDAVVVRRNDGAITAEYERIARPAPEANELLVVPELIGICGSDLEQLHGHMDSFPIEFPHTLGHEWSGTVLEVGADVVDFQVGDRVLGHGDLGGNRWFGVTHDGAMADVFRVPAAMCLPIPASVSFDSAALIEPFACVLQGMRTIGGVNASDTVHVYGLGAIGLSAVVQAVTAGARVVALDVSEKRRELALRLGATAALDSSTAEGLTDRIEQAVGQPLADLVIEASGVPVVQAMAIETAGEHGRVLLMGISAGTPVPARLGLIQQRLLTVTSSVGAPPAIWPAAVRFVQQAGLDLSPIISCRMHFDEVGEAVARASDPGREVKVVLSPRGHR